VCCSIFYRFVVLVFAVALESHSSWGSTALPSRVWQWVKKEWDQWLIFPWSGQCFESSSGLWHLWVVRCWRGYLSAARCKWFAYGPADATATPIISCSHKIHSVLPFWCQLTQVVLEKRPLNGCSSKRSLTPLVGWQKGHMALKETCST